MNSPQVFTSSEAAVTAVVDVLLHTPSLDSVALTGGRAGMQITTQLIARWPNDRPLRLWHSDERFLPLGDDERNDTAALAALETRPPHHIDIESALGPESCASLDECAQDYAQRVDAHGLPQIAVVSIGPDGHVASLFPGHQALAEQRASVIAIADSPKPPPARITWTLPLLLQCPRILLVAVGADKHSAVERVLARDTSLPATALAAAGAELFIYA